jgi:hypothetical protein
VLSYDPNSVSQEKGRLLTERSGGPSPVGLGRIPIRVFHWRLIHSLLVSRRRWRCNLTPDIVNCCWLVPVVFPSLVEGVFHVKSRVSCGLIPLLVVICSPSFITTRELVNHNHTGYTGYRPVVLVTAVEPVAVKRKLPSAPSIAPPTPLEVPSHELATVSTPAPTHGSSPSLLGPTPMGVPPREFTHVCSHRPRPPSAPPASPPSLGPTRVILLVCSSLS